MGSGCSASVHDDSPAVRRADKDALAVVATPTPQARPTLRLSVPSLWEDTSAVQGSRRVPSFEQPSSNPEVFQECTPVMYATPLALRRAEVAGSDAGWEDVSTTDFHRSSTVVFAVSPFLCSTDDPQSPTTSHTTRRSSSRRAMLLLRKPSRRSLPSAFSSILPPINGSINGSPLPSSQATTTAESLYSDAPSVAICNVMGCPDGFVVTEFGGTPSPSTPLPLPCHCSTMLDKVSLNVSQV